MKIKIKTGEILETKGIITDANEGRELGYLVCEPKDNSLEGWICPKEKVCEVIK